MQAMQEQKRDLDIKITQEVSRLAASAANDVTTAKAHLNSLEASLGGTEGTCAQPEYGARAACRPGIQRRFHPHDVRGLRQRLRQSQDQDDVQTPESRIISSRRVPLIPQRPKRGLIVGASIPLGLLLGVLAALLAEKLGPLMPVRVNGAPRAAIVPPIAAHASSPQKPQPTPAPSRCGTVRRSWARSMIQRQLRAADYVLDYPASKYAHAMAALVRQLEASPNRRAPRSWR